MPRGPQGQRRPTDVVGNAAHVMKIATGEIEETGYNQPAKVKSDKAGGKARALALTPVRRTAIAVKSAAARWETME